MTSSSRDCGLQNIDDLATGSAGGYYTGQIFYDIFVARYGHGGGGIVLMGIPMLGMFFCEPCCLLAPPLHSSLDPLNLRFISVCQIAQFCLDLVLASCCAYI